MLLSRRIDDRRSSSSARTRSSSRSPAPGTRPCWPRPRRCSGPPYDWFYTYYRDRALCLGLGMTADRDAALGRRRRRRSRTPAGGRCRRHWGHKNLNIVSASTHRHPVPPGRRAAPRRGCAAARCRGDRRPDVSFQGDEVVLCHHRRRHHQRGRVLGVAEHGLQPQAAGGLPRRGQRLRHLGAGRGQHRRRLDLEARRRLSRLYIQEVDGCDPLASLRGDEARGGLLPRSGRARRWCTRT